MAVRSRYLWMFLMCGTLVKYADSACFLPPQTSKKGNPVNYVGGGGLVADIAACQALCDAAAYCQAADFLHSGTSVNCIFMNVTQTPPYTDDTDYSLLIKTACTSGSSPCTMTRSPDTMGDATRIQLKLTNADQCGSACLYVTECTGVAYSGGSCSLYDGTPSESNAGDALTHVKYTCSGKDCCITGTETMKASSAALETLTSSIDACETACIASSNCHSVYFNNDVCYMYTAAPTTETYTGSIYSVKSCTGTPTYPFTLTEDCYGSDVTKPTQTILFVFFLVVLAMNIL